MAKRTKQTKQAPAPVAQPMQAAPAKLTKRNATPMGATLVATDKTPKTRAPHTQAAWAAVVAALPCTAAHLATLPALADPGCVSPQAFISYMQRRGFLMAE